MTRQKLIGSAVAAALTLVVAQAAEAQDTLVIKSFGIVICKEAPDSSNPIHVQK